MKHLSSLDLLVPLAAPDGGEKDEAAGPGRKPFGYGRGRCPGAALPLPQPSSLLAA